MVIFIKEHKLYLHESDIFTAKRVIGRWCIVFEPSTIGSKVLWAVFIACLPLNVSKKSIPHNRDKEHELKPGSFYKSRNMLSNRDVHDHKTCYIDLRSRLLNASMFIYKRSWVILNCVEHICVRYNRSYSNIRYYI